MDDNLKSEMNKPQKGYNVISHIKLREDNSKQKKNVCLYEFLDVWKNIKGKRVWTHKIAQTRRSRNKIGKVGKGKNVLGKNIKVISNRST